MKKLVSSMFLLLMLLFAVGATAAHGQISVGIQIGAPPPPRVVVVPARPGPDFVWVEGYWYPVGHHYRWHNGYWTRPPYEEARWVPPRHDGERYYAGYWDGGRGRVEHDHHWDRHHERDWHHDRDDHDRDDHHGRDDHRGGDDHHEHHDDHHEH